MQQHESSSKPSTNRRRRRRPRKNRRNLKNEKDDNIKNPSKLPQQKQQTDEERRQLLSLTELSSEANALEKQLGELQTQLKINYSNLPSKEQGRVVSAIAAEQISTTEEEINYVRDSLKKTYRQIFATDLMYVIKHRIEEKLWRYIFYAGIEEIRSKLRKSKSDSEGLQKILYQRIDHAFKFYRDLNQTIKSEYHIDTKVLGIESFLQLATQTDEKLSILLQSNYIYMGDLARYHAQQSSRSKKKTLEYWALAKTCYSRAVDAYRKSGKPYSQLALVSISNGSAMDVVWYYCMSLAVKYPSSVGRDNLRSFYQKIRFNSKSKDDTTLTGMISYFVESFLQMHQAVMFIQEGQTLNPMNPITNQMGQTITVLIKSITHELSKSTVSFLHILRTTLTRTLGILLISIWIMQGRLKDKANFSIRPTLVIAQIHLYTFAFQLLSTVYRSSEEGLESVKSDLDPKVYQSLENYLDETLSPALSIWSTFLSTDITTLAHYSMTASTDTRNREPEKKTLMKSIQSLLSILIHHPSFPEQAGLPITYPLSEDLLLLGVVPLSPFHAKVDYFKEKAYEVMDESRKQVRWGRVRALFSKMADSSSFEFIQYSAQGYSIIDENAKRQQQNKFMKALATQRLMEQVSSLEKNVNRMQIQRVEDVVKQKKEVYTCVIDVTTFLDGLDKVKKWVNQTLNVNSRVQNSILEVIVPLEVIDALDQHKKGTTHTNMLARESIRYLDQKLLENNRTEETNPTSSYLRTQKVNEKLNDWTEASSYWIGEESRSNVVNELLSDESESDYESDQESVSSEELFNSRTKRTEESDVEQSDEEEETDTETDEEEIPYTLDDVPKSYRPILSCLLYYHSKQQKRQENQPERLVLVTNDEDLAWWAELFGDVKSRKRLLIKTVSEWDQLVNKLDFEKEYDFTWKKN